MADDGTVGVTEEQWTFQTCHRRFQQWIHSGELGEALRLLALHLHECGKLNLEEAFVHATFASAKKGLAIGPTRRGKGMKIVAVAAANNLHSPYLSKALRQRNVRLSKKSLPAAFSTPSGPAIGDKAHDSDGLDQKLESEHGIELIAPNSRKRSKTQDGRKLRRYRKRWKIERLFAWLHNFCRLVTRWEYHIENFLDSSTSLPPPAPQTFMRPLLEQSCQSLSNYRPVKVGEPEGTWVYIILQQNLIGEAVNSAKPIHINNRNAYTIAVLSHSIGISLCC